jgi:hypothetical protein
MQKPGGSEKPRAVLYAPAGKPDSPFGAQGAPTRVDNCSGAPSRGNVHGHAAIVHSLFQAQTRTGPGRWVLLHRMHRLTTNTVTFFTYNYQNTLRQNRWTKMSPFNEIHL